MTLNSICSQFRGYGAYGIMDQWILQTYRLSHEDKKETERILKNDYQSRRKIMDLHAKRNQTSNCVYYNKLGAQIDSLVRERNVPLEDLKKLDLRNHYFDFHWITTKGAKAYLEDIKRTIETFAHGVSVKLITGQGNHSKDVLGKNEKTSFMQMELLKEYGHCVEKHPSEQGVLVLTVRARSTYAQHIRYV